MGDDATRASAAVARPRGCRHRVGAESCTSGGPPAHPPGYCPGPWMPPPSAPSSPSRPSTPTSTPARAGRCRAARCTPRPTCSSARLVEGRTRAYFEDDAALRDRQRAAYAARLGAEPGDVALTTCTSEGVVRVLAGPRPRPGDEVLTAPDEHPGLLGPLRALRQRRGVDDPHRAVRGARRRGRPADAPRRLLARELGQRRARARRRSRSLDVPVLLDGAQGVGAVPVDVARARLRLLRRRRARSGCAAPVGTGMLWISPELARPPAPARRRRT